MKIEIILNAYDKARDHCDHLSGQTVHDESDKLTILYYRRVRQYRAFRARILKMDAEKDESLRFLNRVIDKCEVDIRELETEIHSSK